MKDLISVVVPVYNVAKYLNRCVDSILAQTYQNLEVILVDDGSTDESGKICDEYKKNDSRVIVIHTKNGGLSAARNCGLDIVSGSYIGFVDADDYIESDMYELLYDTLISHDADISICSRYMEYEDKKKSVNWVRMKKITELTNEQAMELIMRNGDFNVAVWDKLYKSELFENIRFPLGKFYEDNYVTIQVFHQSSKVCYLPIPLYHYMQRSESLMCVDSIESITDAIEARRFIRDFIHEYHPTIERNADIWLTAEYIAALNRCLRNGYHVSSDLKEVIWQSVRRDWLCCLGKRNIDAKAKMQMLLLRINFRLYCAIFVSWKHIVDKPPRPAADLKGYHVER